MSTGIPSDGLRPGEGRVGERSEPPRAEPGLSPSGFRRERRRFTEAEQSALLAKLVASCESVETFSKCEGISAGTLYRWLRSARALEGASTAACNPSSKPPKSNNPVGKTHRRYGPDQRRRAVEAYLGAGMPQRAFAKLYGIGAKSLWNWLARYHADGPKALEDRPRGRKRGDGGAFRRLSAQTEQAITEVKSSFPYFGLRKVRDYLLRFRGIKVSSGGVRATLARSGIPSQYLPAAPRPRKRKLVRRFERSRPGELWQSDITSFLLARHKQRVYLIAFLDDYSRYVVSFGLYTHQRQEIATETLLDGVQRFGKPLEVLTDQGRQYFAWRGKSDFQKLLIREGIQHVVARAHHPETVGKCERFWETVNAEFWDRCHPQELAEARERLAHFIAHYNHFRPHQGIDGLVPADRLFHAEAALRSTIEAALSKNELELALSEKPRTSVYLFGQIGKQQVSLHGEQGRIVIQTPEGTRRELNLDELGMNLEKDDRDDARRISSEQHEHGASSEAPHAPLPEAHEGESGAASALAGASALGVGDGGGSEAGAPGVHFDAGALVGQGDQGGYPGAPSNPAATSVAIVAASAGGDGGGPLGAAEDPTERSDDGREPPAGCESAREEDRATREGESGSEDPDRSLARVSGATGEGGPEAAGREYGRRCAGDLAGGLSSKERLQAEGTPHTCEDRSASGSTGAESREGCGNGSRGASP